MTKINPLVLLLGSACLVIVILLGVIFYQNHGNSAAIPASPGVATTANPTSSASGTGTNPAPAQGQKTTTVKPVIKTIPSPAPPQVSIYLVTPISGETLTMGAQTTIAWNHAAGVTGQVDLFSAATQAFVGVIAQQITATQLSYPWNTRDIFLSRTSPAKKDIATGTYMIELSFDGNGLKPVFGPAFTVIQ
jgi:hypothetical protein